MKQSALEMAFFKLGQTILLLETAFQAIGQTPVSWLTRRAGADARGQGGGEKAVPTLHNSPFPKENITLKRPFEKDKTGKSNCSQARIRENTQRTLLGFAIALPNLRHYGTESMPCSGEDR